MSDLNTDHTLRARGALFLLASSIAIAGGAAPAQGWTLSSNLTQKAEVAVKETFDSNVYLQDQKPTPANVTAARAAGLHPAEAKHHSFVTTVQPKLTFDYTPCKEFSASLGYAGDYNWFHDADSEDFRIHSFPLKFKGSVGEATWQMDNSFIYIDGNREGPTFARPGDVPAIGGVPMRDRRDAFIFRSGFHYEQPLGDKFFLRPVASAYVHDFKTVQRANPNAAQYVYENYVDRQEITGGLHAGYKLPKATKVLLGYVFGRQDQFSLLGVDSPYDSSFHRILVGLEGSPWSWLKFNLSAGPDIRDFDKQIAGFDDNELLLYVLGSVTLMPSANDTITLFNRRYEQPAYGGPSVYEDITYDVTWQHKFNAQLATKLGFRAYIGDWQAPVSREDWIYTPSASVAYTWRKLTGEVAYSYDWVDGELEAVANSKGREFTRHLVSLGLRYAF